MLFLLVDAADLYKTLDGRSSASIYFSLSSDVVRATVHRSASEQDIKKAYKRLSRKYHPDKNKDPGAEDKFVEVAHGRHTDICIDASYDFISSIRGVI